MYWRVSCLEDILTTLCIELFELSNLNGMNVKYEENCCISQVNSQPVSSSKKTKVYKYFVIIIVIFFAVMWLIELSTLT